MSDETTGWYQPMPNIEPEIRLAGMNWKQIAWMSRGDLLAKQRKIEQKILVENDRNITILNKAYWVCEFALRDKDAKENADAVPENRR
jgi:hypothetical protein